MWEHSLTQIKTNLHRKHVKEWILRELCTAELRDAGVVVIVLANEGK